jgi:hypothetical protein
MARGTQLADLVKMLRAELGHTMEPGVAEQANPRLKVLLSTKQKGLASAMDWPFLERRWETTVSPGTNIIDVPINTPDERINFERPVKLEVLYNSIWLPTFFGIGADEYNVLTDRQDPIQRWRFYGESATAEQDSIELWPSPATEATLRFTGQRVLRPLEADTDRCDLDDLLIVFMVAADLALESEMRNASFKMAMAQERLRMVRQVYPNRDEPLVLGQNLRQPVKKKLILIAPA